jgi:hypothetical protein
MKTWSEFNRSEYEGKAGQSPKIGKQTLNYDDLATADDRMRATAVDCQPSPVSLATAFAALKTLPSIDAVDRCCRKRLEAKETTLASEISSAKA